MSEVIELNRLLAKVEPDCPYQELLRIPAMSVGVYVLPAGAIDRQQPHGQDEIYYVVRGKAKVRLGSKERSVQKGSVILVETGLDHRFFDIKEDLVLLVVFAPAEAS
jgi:mannose-6-phosphate isomerase-like protein (cupin superfamily)